MNCVIVFVEKCSYFIPGGGGGGRANREAVGSLHSPTKPISSQSAEPAVLVDSGDEKM